MWFDWGIELISLLSFRYSSVFECTWPFPSFLSSMTWTQRERETLIACLFFISVTETAIEDTHTKKTTTRWTKEKKNTENYFRLFIACSTVWMIDNGSAVHHLNTLIETLAWSPCIRIVVINDDGRLGSRKNYQWKKIRPLRLSYVLAWLIQCWN